jgi:hypothetical protein
VSQKNDIKEHTMSIQNLIRCMLSGLVITALFSSLTISIARAETIIWSSELDISGDSDVSTEGTLVGAFNFAGPATTINGVEFLEFAVGLASNTVGNYNFSVASGTIGSSATGATSSPFTDLSSEYQALLGSAAQRGDATMTLTLSGLTIGQRYSFQAWVNDSRYPGASGFTYPVDITAGNTVTLNPNTTPLDMNGMGVEGGVGQYAIGRFTADATTQQVEFFGGEVGVVNGFQLREVPEPSTMLTILMPLGLSVVASRRRR